MIGKAHWRSTLPRGAGPSALLLSCLLLAAQWLLLTHAHEAHADEPAPSQHAPHACDLCVAFAAAAPAPAQTVPLALAPAAAPALQAATAALPAETRGRAHRTRAPPALHSA
jgi:hypothetical protein